jgi:hypothetical protein
MGRAVNVIMTEEVYPERRSTVSESVDEGRAALPSLAPADFLDPVIEAYKKDVDRTLLRQNLKLTVEERARKAESVHKSIERLRSAARAEAARR